MEVNKKLGKTDDIVKNLRTLATFYKQKEDYLAEIQCHEQSLLIHETSNNLKEQAVDCNFLGNAFRHHKDKEKALKWFNQTKSLHEKLENTKLAVATQNIIRNLENSEENSS